MEDRPKPSGDRAAFLPGWHVSLHGELADLELWAGLLTDPAKALVTLETIGPPSVNGSSSAPTESALPGGLRPHDVLSFFYLTDPELLKAADENQALAIARRLVHRLNIVMAMSHHTLPMTSGTVTCVSATGTRSTYGKLEFCFGGVPRVFGPVFSSEEYRKLSKREKVEALLSQLAHAGDWERIFNTLEAAWKLVGSQSDLERLCPPELRFDALRRRSNQPRHFVTNGSAADFTFVEGTALLRRIVRIALAHAP